MKTHRHSSVLSKRRIRENVKASGSGFGAAKLAHALNEFENVLYLQCFEAYQGVFDKLLKLKKIAAKDKELSSKLVDVIEAIHVEGEDAPQPKIPMSVDQDNHRDRQLAAIVAWVVNEKIRDAYMFNKLPKRSKANMPAAIKLAFDSATPEGQESVTNSVIVFTKNLSSGNASELYVNHATSVAAMIDEQIAQSQNPDDKFVTSDVETLVNTVLSEVSAGAEDALSSLSEDDAEIFVVDRSYGAREEALREIAQGVVNKKYNEQYETWWLTGIIDTFLWEAWSRMVEQTPGGRLNIDTNFGNDRGRLRAYVSQSFPDIIDSYERLEARKRRFKILMTLDYAGLLKNFVTSVAKKQKKKSDAKQRLDGEIEKFVQWFVNQYINQDDDFSFSDALNYALLIPSVMNASPKGLKTLHPDLIGAFLPLAKKYSSFDGFEAGGTMLGRIISALLSDIDDAMNTTSHAFPSVLLKKLKYTATSPLTSIGSRPDIALDVYKHMPKAFAHFKNVAKEANNISDAEAEAPKNAELGRIAFAPVRVDDQPLELNTQKEQRLQVALKHHFDDSSNRGGEDDKDVFTALQSFMKKGLYSSIIHEPDVDYVYRGLAVPRDWINSFAKGHSQNKDERGGTIRSAKKSGIRYKPRDGIQTSSWTTDPEIARNFAEENASDSSKPRHNIALILKASVKRNKNKFIACEDGLYKLSFAKLYDKEKEVVAIGDINVESATWE